MSEVKDFTVHVVVGDHGIGYHTHGFSDGKGRLELEMLLPVPAFLANMAFYNIINDGRYLRGELEDGISYKIDGFGPMRFKTVSPCYGSGVENEKVLRIIVPDKNLKYPEDEGCDHIFKNQDTEDVEMINHNKEAKNISDKFVEAEKNAEKNPGSYFK